MFHIFGHPVAICCNMLDDVESNLKTVKFFVLHFGRCMMMYSCDHIHVTLLHLEMCPRSTGGAPGTCRAH